MWMFVTGIVLGSLAVAGIVTIFVWLIRNQEHIKKLPVWVYVLSIVLLIFAVAAIGFVIAGGLTM